MVAPPIEKSEPVRQLSKKEQKRLEDEAFERELAEALEAAGAPPLADATADAGAPTGDDNGGDGDGDGSSSSKKKKKKKNKKKGGGDGESGDAAAPAAAPVVELTPKSEEEIEKAKEALAAKLKEKAAKKALSRKNANGTQSLALVCTSWFLRSLFCRPLLKAPLNALRNTQHCRHVLTQEFRRPPFFPHCRLQKNSRPLRKRERRKRRGTWRLPRVHPAAQSSRVTTVLVVMAAAVDAFMHARIVLPPQAC